MADKVYIVMEDWDNCEDYEDNERKLSVLCIATDMQQAEQAIADRKNELIKFVEKLKTEGEDITTDEDSECPDPNLEVSHSFSSRFASCAPGYSWACDYFTWSIKAATVNERLLHI